MPTQFRSNLLHLVLLLSLCIGLAGSGFGATETYVVKKKDTLSSIARAHKTTTKELVRLNSLKSANRIKVGQHLTVPAKPPTEIKYIIKKGDALSAIARKHKVGTRTLVSYNKLPNPDKLIVGDTLLIPLGGAAGPTHRLDADLEKKLNRIPVKSRRWKHIVIHHSGTKNGTVEGMDRYHREERRMENGLAYHFVIGNGNGITNGKIEIAPRWRKQLNGGHLASSYLNTQSIGICLVGDFEKGRPTAKQIESLHALCGYLVRRCNLRTSAIKSHTQINTKPTRCPGKNFPMTKFISDFRG